MRRYPWWESAPFETAAIQAQAFLARDPDTPNSPSPWECHACQTEGSGAYRSPLLRQVVHCGWIPRTEWKGGPPGTKDSGMPHKLGGGLVTYDVDVCPGWLMAQPFVHEALEAAAVPDGEIASYCPDGNALLLQARLAANGAQNLYQIHRMKKKD